MHNTSPTGGLVRNAPQHNTKYEALRISSNVVFQAFLKISYFVFSYFSNFFFTMEDDPKAIIYGAYEYGYGKPYGFVTLTPNMGGIFFYRLMEDTQGRSKQPLFQRNLTNFGAFR